ncbi:MAG: xanthine dehydrogenase family protein subunit M, partial [Chloroflexi bacterium]
MIPAAFDYIAPKTLPEAVAELVKHGDEAKVLAGGHSLIPLMKLRLSTPSFIVDIGRIKDLNYIREADGHIAFGALTTHHDIEFSDLVKRRLPVLSSAASQIGDPQVRNRGTIGGAAAHADPFGDFPACLLALDAEFKVVGPRGERTIAAKDFFVETFTNALEPQEV